MCCWGVEFMFLVSPLHDKAVLLDNLGGVHLFERAFDVEQDLLTCWCEYFVRACNECSCWKFYWHLCGDTVALL